MKKAFYLVITLLSTVLLMGVSVAASEVQTYTVTLQCGPEGMGDAYTLTKTKGQPLELAHLKADITADYGMMPKGGSSDQRVFIKWSTSYDSVTSRGTGTDYFDTYTAEADVTLYAIWGYPIMFNADGGKYADGSSKKLEYVADYAEWMGENTDPRSMYRYCMPDWNGDIPVKEGAHRVGNSSGYAYGLIKVDGTTFFTWEGYGENLTIPPEGGGYYPSGNYNSANWSMFRCVKADAPDNPYGIAFPEFIAVWEPMVTYDANGGKGNNYSEYLEWGWKKLWKYENYTIDSNSFTHPDGLKFTGWNTKPDGSGKSFSPGQKITSFTARKSDPVVLYAQWETLHTHSYTEIVVSEPTCELDGLKKYTCECGDEYTQVIAATGDHNYVKTESIAPTCALKGKDIYTCEGCGNSYEEIFSATGKHNYEVTVTQPTCALEGKAEYICSVCSDMYTEVIAATGNHNYGEWMLVTEPTYISEGKEQRSCENCDAKEFRPIEMLEYINPFTDVKAEYWFSDAVEYCAKRGYINGMSDTVFSPGTELTRAQFLTILAKYDGADLEAYNNKDTAFEDVKVGHWYNGAVVWALENEYTAGISQTKFGPNNSVTRAQLARFFYVYSVKNGKAVDVRADITSFPDAQNVPVWAAEPIEWAVGTGLISGVAKDGVNYLYPNGTATRAQAAVMFKAFSLN